MEDQPAETKVPRLLETTERYDPSVWKQILFAVDGGAAGLTRTPLSTMDQTRKQVRLEFDGTPARMVGTDGNGWTVLSRVLDLAAVALAAEQVGGAQAGQEQQAPLRRSLLPPRALRPTHRHLAVAVVTGSAGSSFCRFS